MLDYEDRSCLRIDLAWFLSREHTYLDMSRNNTQCITLKKAVERDEAVFSAFFSNIVLNTDSTSDSYNNNTGNRKCKFKSLVGWLRPDHTQNDSRRTQGERQ